MSIPHLPTRYDPQRLATNPYRENVPPMEMRRARGAHKYRGVSMKVSDVNQKRAAVFARGDQLYVESMRQTEASFWIATDPIRIENSDAALVAATVRAALNTPSACVPNPRLSDDRFAEMGALAGVKSWRGFARTAKYLGVKLEGSTITLTPYRLDGPSTSFEPIPEAARVLRRDDPKLGEAIIGMFASMS